MPATVRAPGQAQPKITLTWYPGAWIGRPPDSAERSMQWPTGWPLPRVGDTVSPNGWTDLQVRSIEWNLPDEDDPVGSIEIHGA